MQSNSRDSRLSGLVAVLGLLALLLGLIFFLVLPDLRFATYGILLLGVILLAAAFILDYRKVGRTLTSRRGRFGTATTVIVSIIIGIMLLVNAISVDNYHRFDLTGVAQFTLTSQTKDALANLETPIDVLCFFTPADPFGGLNSYATNLLTEYQNYTNKLTVSYIDPDQHPDQARQYNVNIYSSIVFETENLRRLVEPQELLITEGQQIVAVEAEHAFTSALLEVTGVVQKKIYFLTGHGESGISSDYSEASLGLRDNLYKVDTLDLLLTKKVPDDCAALIIAGPEEPLNSSEVNILNNYLENGGWAMILLNPGSSPEIVEMLSPWGIDIEDGIVIDESDYVAPNKDNPIVPRTRNFFGLSSAYFPGATAIIPQPDYTPKLILSETGSMTSQIVWTHEDSQLELYSLIRSSVDSWLEKDYNPDLEPEFDEATDLKGPLNMGFLVIPTLIEDAESLPSFWNTRIIIFGDSDFASNQHFYEGSNGDLFLNSVELLTEGKELISIERKVLPFRRLVVGPEALNFIQISSIGLLPLLVLITGGVIWWRRK